MKGLFISLVSFIVVVNGLVRSLVDVEGRVVARESRVHGEPFAPAYGFVKGGEVVGLIPCFIGIGLDGLTGIDHVIYQAVGVAVFVNGLLLASFIDIIYQVTLGTQAYGVAQVFVVVVPFAFQGVEVDGLGLIQRFFNLIQEIEVVLVLAVYFFAQEVQVVV